MRTRPDYGKIEDSSSLRTTMEGTQLSKSECRARMLPLSLYMLVGSLGLSSAGDVLPRSGFPELEQPHPVETLEYRPPALLLLHAKQVSWPGPYQEAHVFRRLLVFDDDAAAAASKYVMSLRQDWRVNNIEARTVLPDGATIDASGSATIDRGFVQIQFPEARAGSLFDLHLTLTTEGLDVEPWYIGDSYPTVESRFILIPRKEMAVDCIGNLLTADQVRPSVVATVGGTAYVWKFEDIPPLRLEPNSPPPDDIMRNLMVRISGLRGQASKIPSLVSGFWSPLVTDSRSTQFSRTTQSISTRGLTTSTQVTGGSARPRGVYLPIDGDWRSLALRRKVFSDAWLARGKRFLNDWAEEITGNLDDPEQKIEAIRRAVRSGLSVTQRSALPAHDSPREVLDDGWATSFEAAAISVALLRAAGVAADLAAYRPRDQGRHLADYTSPLLLNEFLVRVKIGRKTLFFSPYAELPTGELPVNSRGVSAIPYAADFTGPVEFPDVKASENRSEVLAEVKLEADGRLTGSSSHVYSGVAALTARERLVRLGPALQRVAARRSLETVSPAARLDVTSIRGLDEHGRDLVVQNQWSVPSYATPAQGCLRLPPVLFHRVDTAEWNDDPPRRYPIDLGMAYEQASRVRIKLPPGFTIRSDSVSRSKRVGQGIRYSLRINVLEDGVVIKRELRMERYRFAATAYGTLREWFNDLASFEADEIVACAEAHSN